MGRALVVVEEGVGLRPPLDAGRFEFLAGGTVAWHVKCLSGLKKLYFQCFRKKEEINLLKHKKHKIV